MQAEKIDTYAAITASEIAKTIAARPEDIAAHGQALADLKLALCQEGAGLCGGAPDDEFVWTLAHELPDFEAATLYRTRTSLNALATAVFLGWLLGGFLATFLGFLGLGGEIWRPCAILACLWLEEYLSSNPKARRVLLAVLGLGALGRFAVALASGMTRLTGLGSMRQLIFGAGPRPNFFKSLWLWLGAFFLYVFFAKKITGLDIASFEQNLARQIRQRLNLVCMVIAAVGERDRQLAALAAEPGARKGQADMRLANAVLAVLDSLDAGKRRYLRSCLARAGYTVLDSGDEYLVWDGAEHGGKYNSLGMVRDGDKCRILERPHEEGGKLVKGLAQRVTP